MSIGNVEPRIVTPEEAQTALDIHDRRVAAGREVHPGHDAEWRRLVYTIATAPEREEPRVSESRIVTPEEAARWLAGLPDSYRGAWARSLAQRVASEPERTRAVEAKIERLVSALERTEANFRAAVNGKPVRDMAENLAENAAALKETKSE